MNRIRLGAIMGAAVLMSATIGTPEVAAGLIGEPPGTAQAVSAPTVRATEPATEPAPDGRDASAPAASAPSSDMKESAAVTVPLATGVAAEVSAPEVPVACVGNGTDGSRVQLVYAREAGKPDRFAAVQSDIRAEVARIDAVFQASAQKTKDNRRVRWVTADCVPTITRVTVPAGTFTKSSDIATTEEALADRGLDRKGRKYLVFADAARICGVSTVYRDSAAKNNANDGRNAQHARIDTGCWNSPDWSVAAHELVHMMGGVQPTAPNALGAYHCDDANDLMCYRETARTKLRVVCGPEHAGLLDCRGDDYFNPRPRKGSYLDKNWNVADSSFLDASAPRSDS